MAKAKLILCFLVCGVLSACLGQSTPPECAVPKNLVVTKSTKDFILPKQGGQYTYQGWTIAVEPGVLKEDASLRLEDKTGSNLGVEITHRLKTAGGQTLTVVEPRPPSASAPPIRILAVSPIQYTGGKRITATYQSEVFPVHTLIVMQSPTKQAQPDFSKVPSATAKSFIVEPQVQSLASNDSGWLYILAHDLEGKQQCFQETVKEIAQELGDIVGQYVDDPCKSCQVVAEAAVDVNKCQDMVNNLSTTLCETFLAESARESWFGTLLNSGCKGATWLGSWVVSYGIELYAGVNPAEAICNNADNLKKFLEQYKIRADCMCDLFIRDPRCKDTSENQDCKNIWQALVNVKSEK